MNQKPSYRIKKIRSELIVFHGKDPKAYGGTYGEEAILRYLDEQYEKNRPCEHKSAYQVDSTLDVYYNVCNDCGVLFLANPKEDSGHLKDKE